MVMTNLKGFNLNESLGYFLGFNPIKGDYRRDNTIIFRFYFAW